MVKAYGMASNSISTRATNLMIPKQTGDNKDTNDLPVSGTQFEQNGKQI